MLQRGIEVASCPTGRESVRLDLTMRPGGPKPPEVSAAGLYGLVTRGDRIWNDVT